MAQKVRTVITGMGVVSPLGTSLRTTWESIMKGKSAIRPNKNRHSRISGQISPDLITEKCESLFDNRAALPLSRTPNFVKLALIAASEAFKHSDLKEVCRKSPFSIGTIIGSGFGRPLSRIKPEHKLSPYDIPGGLMESAATQIAIKFGFKGPSNSVSAACATGSVSIGNALSIIRSRKAKVILCGGVDFTFEEDFIHEGFSACRALCKKFYDSPEKASRPFEKQRNGFVISEGAGVIVLEELEHAKERDAEIFGEILGHGQTCDSFHITAPLPSGSAATKAMKMALEDSPIQVKTENLDFIVAHAASTKLGDKAESTAIKNFLGSKVNKTPIVAMKSYLGHTLGAAGTIELILGVQAMNNGILPAIKNLESKENSVLPELNFVTKNRQKSSDLFLANSFGFGGHNSCLLVASKAFCKRS